MLGRGLAESSRRYRHSKPPPLRYSPGAPCNGGRGWAGHKCGHLSCIAERLRTCSRDAFRASSGGLKEERRAAIRPWDDRGTTRMRASGNPRAMSGTAPAHLRAFPSRPLPRSSPRDHPTFCRSESDPRRFPATRVVRTDTPRRACLWYQGGVGDTLEHDGRWTHIGSAGSHNLAVRRAQRIGQWHCPRRRRLLELAGVVPPDESERVDHPKGRLRPARAPDRRTRFVFACSIGSPFVRCRPFTRPRRCGP